MHSKDWSPPSWIQAPADASNRELRKRLERLLSGERRIDDLQALFLDQRFRAQGRRSVREIGDFIAHRDRRDKGEVVEVVADLYRSAHFWAWTQLNLPAALSDLSDAANAARANLRRATDDQLKGGCNLKRPVAQSVLEAAIKKLGEGRQLTQREKATFNYLAGNLIWNPAFDDQHLCQELEDNLLSLGLLRDSEVESFRGLGPFIALFTITQMHGAVIDLPSGPVGLRAGFENKFKRLEVRAQIELRDFVKPIWIPMCVFWTDLDPQPYCEDRLLSNPDAWLEPLEVNSQGKLSVI